LIQAWIKGFIGNAETTLADYCVDAVAVVEDGAGG
jgi:hypothetical protein